MTVSIVRGSPQRRESNTDWDFGGARQALDRRPEVLRARQDPRHEAARAERPYDRHERRPSCGLLRQAPALVAGVAGSTSGSSDDADPTFERAAGSSITYEEPVADVADLLAPAAEGQPWLILGSVYDPKSGTTVAATWSADDVAAGSGRT